MVLKAGLSPRRSSGWSQMASETDFCHVTRSVLDSSTKIPFKNFPIDTASAVTA